MNSSSQLSGLNVKKLGLLAMTPIALMIHGLVLWIPVNIETKKEDEPVKEEELQAIGDMALPLPIASSPTAIPSTASTPAPSPAKTTSIPSKSPVIIERIVEKVIQTESQPKPAESPVKKPDSSPTPIVSPTPPPAEALTPEGTVNKLLTGIPCPGESRCSQVSAPQDKILATLAKQFGNQHQEINDIASPKDAGDRPEESQIVGYRIKDNKTNEFLYFILPPVAGNKVNVIFKDEEQMIALGGVI